MSEGQDWKVYYDAELLAEIEMLRAKPLWFSQRGVSWSVQHRKPRGRGGDNNPANLVLACGSATTGCHGWMESQRTLAYEGGWLLMTHEDPTHIPVQHWAYGRVFLTADGRYDTHGIER